ncbi:hypothetical protein IFU08_12400 [Microbacterium sp. CFBP 8790]|uniref:hypothetical protein n=1 Tax=unclassified Microbacterium TaxID=2609290 RepID=UPI0017841F6B|nr:MULTISPECIES: hypothetical protein [unclassified Microbacterium]MBD8207790.1 hypothetical protein [Microbacterium sp. CFBP 8801]MBD8510358.1 hypothetical protein [Microbacterium sp. CFBP 8790]
MVKVVDPIRDAIVKELLQFRKQPGYPGPHRLDGLFHLVEALGEGIPERAYDELSRLYEGIGRDPDTDVGAYFYLCGWNVGLGTIDERRLRYVAEHYAGEISAPWRRAKKGMYELATIIRDRDETDRPSVVVSIFQSGAAFQPILDFTMAYESWQPPIVIVNGVTIDLDFHVHKDPEHDERYIRRFVLPDAPLDTTVGYGEQMGRIFVHWPMPVWPTWRLLAWVAEPRILAQMRTVRNRAIEIALISHYAVSNS